MSASPVASTLTRKVHFKPFRINTYKKGGEGEGGYLPPTRMVILRNNVAKGQCDFQL